MLQEYRLHLLQYNSNLSHKGLYNRPQTERIREERNSAEMLLYSSHSCTLLPASIFFLHSIRNGLRLSVPVLNQENGLEDLLTPSRTFLPFFCVKLAYLSPSPTTPHAAFLRWQHLILGSQVLFTAALSPVLQG